MPDWTDTIANRRNGGVAGFVGANTPLAAADTSPAGKGTVIVADGKGGYELLAPGTFVAAGTTGMKLTSGPTRPSSPSLYDIYMGFDPNFDPVTQFPWDAFFLADRLSLAADAQVPQFDDLTGNARHGTTPGNKPFFRPKVAKTSDRAAVEFVAASNTYLKTPEWTVGTAQPNTIVAVGRISDVSQCLWDAANTGNDQRLSRASNGDWNLKASTSTTLAAPGDSRPHCFVAVYNGVSSSLTIDGAVVATGDAGTNSLRGLTMGARNDLGVPTSGYLNCLGVITDLLTADQLSMWHWWARNYYQLPWAGT